METSVKVARIQDKQAARSEALGMVKDLGGSTRDMVLAALRNPAISFTAMMVLVEYLQLVMIKEKEEVLTDTTGEYTGTPGMKYIKKTVRPLLSPTRALDIQRALVAGGMMAALGNLGLAEILGAIRK